MLKFGCNVIKMCEGSMFVSPLSFYLLTHISLSLTCLACSRHGFFSQTLGFTQYFTLCQNDPI